MGRCFSGVSADCLQTALCVCAAVCFVSVICLLSHGLGLSLHHEPRLNPAISKILFDIIAIFRRKSVFIGKGIALYYDIFR